MGDWVWVIIPLTALMIPIVAILVRHQQRMAELIHGSHERQALPSAEAQQLRQEIQELKQLVHQQAIATDTLNRRLAGETRPSLENESRSGS